MEAKAVHDVPAGPGWLYEPKWDGFRCLAFRSGDRVVLQSKSGQPLGRYFPELVEALGAVAARRFVLDGEIVIPTDDGLSFDDLLQRIHPAESRVRRLAHETPATLLAFDLLVDARGDGTTGRPLAQRRAALEDFFATVPPTPRLRLSPATPEQATAERWMRERARGLDGVVAKRLDAAYLSGERSAMQKVKRLRTADCVVGGFRYATSGGEVGSLLLGLYDAVGLLHHVGFSSSFTAGERRALRGILEPLIGPPGFTGHAPGGPSRWSDRRSMDWEPLRPELVCEVRWDHFSGGRFRHGTKLLRWRPDKAPAACTLDQVEPSGAPSAWKLLGTPAEVSGPARSRGRP
jgi:ATP-dependent DNA ligase